MIITIKKEVLIEAVKDCGSIFIYADKQLGHPLSLSYVKKNKEYVNHHIDNFDGYFFQIYTKEELKEIIKKTPGDTVEINA